MSKKADTLPSVDSILSKLKSDGTFDQFRRTCLDHIQGEPSFRAYSEHLEVVSRRYLQGYKWRESSTKNEVRGRLRDHALGVIVSRDIQVGTPLIDIVEKVLESKARDLLPKICQTVECLCEARAKQAAEAVVNKEVIPVSVQQSVVEAPKSECVDLSLPIDLPGLNTPAKPLKMPGKQDNKPKVKKEPPKPKPKPLPPGAKVSKPKTINNKEMKSVVEKEKPKVYRIPKKLKVDPNEAPTTGSVKEEKCEPSKNPEKMAPGDDSKPPSKRRSARLASQTDSKASSDNEGSLEEAPPTKKRRRSSKNSPSSQDDSDLTSDPYQSDDTSEETLSQHSNKAGIKTSSKKKWREARQKLSKSPSLVITRYNRSVKPNRRYYNASTGADDEELTDVLGEPPLPREEEEDPLPLSLDTTRPCDDGAMEIQKDSVLFGDDRVNTGYQMIKPKPKPLKIKKNLMKAFRSRKRTKSRINFFQHR